MSCWVSTRACHCGCFGFKLPHPEKAIRFMFCKTADHQETWGASSAEALGQYSQHIGNKEEIHCSALKQLMQDQSPLSSEKVMQNKGCAACKEA